MAFDPLDRSKWDEEQAGFRQQRSDTSSNADMLMRAAGQKRGSRGEVESPPWTEHMGELFPGVPQTTVENLLGAHRYGMTEGYVEHAHDLIADEFAPRAEKIAKQANIARNSMGAADTSLMSAGIRALAGRRYTSAGVTRRARVAHERFGQAQAAGDALQGELQNRLDDVEEMKRSLGRSKWQPHD